MKLIKTVKNADNIYPLNTLAEIISSNNLLFNKLLLSPKQLGKINPVAWVVHCTLHYS